jgi:uncharacterized membrane protein (GlpM family)
VYVQILIKAVLSLVIIFSATGVAKKFPSAAGLIGVMPLAGALVLAWVYIENRGDSDIMQAFSKGALWGILPSIFFYVVALFCFKKGFSLPATLLSSFVAWGLAALAHQIILK